MVLARSARKVRGRLAEGLAEGFLSTAGIDPAEGPRKVGGRFGGRKIDAYR